MSRREARVSVIIPTLNEEGSIGELLSYLLSVPLPYEFIVVDGGSHDRTREEVAGFPVRLLQSTKGRGKQLNTGAKQARGNILYFLHADSFPPPNYLEDLMMAFEEGNAVGSYRLRFDTGILVLRFFAYLTRLNLLICRGGDQSLFVKADVFRELGGFDERYRVYEDMEFIGRARHRYPFRVLQGYVTTSDRKYRAKGWWRLQFHFGVIHFIAWRGAGPERIAAYYDRHIGLHGNEMKSD